MNSLPLISIVIPTYNSEKYLVECLDSVKNQTYPNLEVLIIDGNSTDSTVDIIKGYLSNDNWHLFTSKKGVSRQRNVGLKNYKGDFIYFLDSDDYFEKTFIENLYNTLLCKNLDIVTPEIVCATYVDKELKGTYKLAHNIRKDINKDNFFIGIFESFLAGPTKLYKKEMVQDIFFDEKLSCGEDHLFNYAIAERTPFKFGICENATYFYRKVEGVNPIEKRLNKSSTMFFKRFLPIVKNFNRNSDNYKDAYKLLKDDAQQFISAYVKAKKTIPCNMLGTRLYLFLNNHSKKRWFYLFPKPYMKRNS